MKKAEFMEKVRSTRAEWDEAVSKVPKESMETPINALGWTVKDVVAHITWYAREMVVVVQTRTLTGSPWWEMPLDPRNDTIQAANRERTLESVLAEDREVHATLLGALEGLDDQDLNDSGRFKEMPADWTPWELIASNTFTHYPDHSAELRAWLGDTTAPSGVVAESD